MGESTSVNFLRSDWVWCSLTRTRLLASTRQRAAREATRKSENRIVVEWWWNLVSIKSWSSALQQSSKLWSVWLLRVYWQFIQWYALLLGTKMTPRRRESERVMTKYKDDKQSASRLISCVAERTRDEGLLKQAVCWLPMSSLTCDKRRYEASSVTLLLPLSTTLTGP